MNTPAQRYYKVLVTRDTTESATIPVVAANADLAEEIATSRDAEREFSRLFQVLDSCLQGSLYLGDPDEDVEEITLKEYEAMLGASRPTFNKTLYLEAYPVSGFGDGPRYAEYELTDSSYSSIKTLQRLCEDNVLSECRVSDGPQWENEEFLRLTGHELVVTSSGFWFTATPKHADYKVETRYIEISKLDAIISQSDEVNIFLGDDVDNLRSLISEACDHSESVS